SPNPRDFFPVYLENLIAAIGGDAGIVWLMNDEEQRIELSAERGLNEIGLADSPAGLTHNQKVVSEVFSTAQAVVRQASQQNNPLWIVAKTLVLAPLHQGKRCVGVVELFLKRDVPPESRGGLLQFVEQMAALGSRFLSRDEQTPAAEAEFTNGFLDDFSRLLYDLQRGERLQPLATVTASDGRLFLGVDRVSVIVKRGRKVETLAVSGQERVHRRANLVRSMESLAEQVIRTGEPILFTGQTQQWPAALETELASYLDESRARLVAFVALKEPVELIPMNCEDQEPQTDDQQSFGCLVVEHLSSTEFSDSLQKKLDLLTGHIAAALHSARRQERIFLLPLWRMLGGTLQSLRGRTLLKTVLAVALLIGLIVSLIAVPYDYRVTSQGRLMPTGQQNVFAPWDGEVVEVKVEGGSTVKKGDVLLQLQNNELEAEWVKLNNTLAEKEKLIRTLNGRISLLRRFEDRDERLRLESQKYETEVEVEDIQKELIVLKTRREGLIVRAPMDGLVATFQLDLKLRGRPVQKGELLLEIMEPSGKWQVELDVPDLRMGHLLAGQGATDDALEVEFILATRPESSYQGQVQQINVRTELSEKEGSVVPVIVELDKTQLTAEDLRIGADVRAKINCGSKSLGYCLFGDVIEFLQKTLWL
ncbi:MAG: HlyD family efflux transporter periplasmic adaptor subunit, partial [Planctomycetaceae bacterium]|nr:HlyD family efflux transporter periplasmic adaptor subunit [Planctomycetaceae bacterium]